MTNWQHLYVVFRIDHEALSDRNVPAQHAITIKEILPSEEAAVREVERLNALNSHRGCEYWFQSAKYYPVGR